MDKSNFLTDKTETEESSINWTKLFFISFFLGFTGIGRFLAGRKTSALIKFLTMIAAGIMMGLGESKAIPAAPGAVVLGGVLLWWYIDLLLLASGRFKDSDGRRVTNTSTLRYISLFFVVIYGGICIIGGIASIAFPELKEPQQARQAQQKVVPQEPNKEQIYNEEYGKLMDAFELSFLFKKNNIAANNACNKSSVQIGGMIMEMGTNSYGNYIDLSTGVAKDANDVRVFLENSDWNNVAISKIKRKDKIVAGGLCYGQTELFGGIKSKIIIGNAKILKVGKKYL